MTVIAVIQARMGSTRLPGKSMMDLAGRPVIMHLVDRARNVPSIDRVAVATSTAPADDVLVEYLAGQGVDVVRGSEHDVLGRYAAAARQVLGDGASDDDVVVRLTGDDPFKDPAVIETAVRTFLDGAGRWDYVCNNQPPWLPEGQDTEVMSLKALLTAADEATDPYEHEHVTPFLYRHPDRFRCHAITGGPDLSHHRWTLDTAEDLAFFRRVLSELPDDPQPAMQTVLDVVSAHPDIAAINADVGRSALYRPQQDQ